MKVRLLFDGKLHPKNKIAVVYQPFCAIFVICFLRHIE